MYESEAGAVEDIDEGMRVREAAASSILRAIPLLTKESLLEAYGATSKSEFLCGRYNLIRATAHEWVRIANKLVDLPCIAKAYEDGLLGWDQLRPLTKFARPETDESWAVEAPRCFPGWLWRESERYAKVTRAEAEEIHRSRAMRFEWNADKTELTFWGHVGAEEGAKFQQRVEERSEDIELQDEPYDPQGARNVDALMELTEGGGGKAEPVTVVVHADVEVLTGEPKENEPVIAETENGARLCSETVKRLMCGANIEWMLSNNGMGVGIGWEDQRVPARLRREVVKRDLHCRFPGCRRRRRLRAHHIRHAPHGPTDIDNLIALCETHHRLVHEGGWSIRGRHSTGVRFYDPRGRPYRTAGELQPR